MTSVNIHTFLAEQGIQPEAILHLLTQGIEIEKLRLEVCRCVDAECIDSRVIVMQGERLIRRFMS